MNRFIRKILLLAVVLFAFARAATAQTEFYLRDGDRVIFYGDSITEQNHFAAWIETFALARFPQRRFEFVNSGWSGDWVVGGGGGKMRERVRRDVAAHRPTVVVAMFGMNDAGYRAFDQSFFDVYTEGYRKLVAELKKTNARTTLLRPSAFDEITESTGEWRTIAPRIENGGYNKVLIRYGDFVGELARENDFTVVDANQPLVAAVQKLNAIDKKAAAAIVPDRIHPGETGGLIIAAAILKAWHAQPPVTTIEIDAARKTIVKTENAKISNLNNGANLGWQQTDAALPLPINPEHKTMRLAAQAANVFDDLNQQKLLIKNLNAGRYELKIDGQTIGVWTNEELSRGVNLAECSTPMLRQAAAIYDLSLRRAKIRFIRWREIETAFAQNQTLAAQRTAAALTEVENEIIKQQRLTAQPVAHRYQLTALK